MKKIILKSLVILTAITSAINLFAYEYDFNNNIDIPLILKVKPWGIDKDFCLILPVESSAKLVWEFGSRVGLACIGSIQWAKWKGSDAEYKQWASDRGRIPESKQTAFVEKYRPAFNRMEMKLEPNAAYDLIVANSKSLAKGIDTLACKALSIAKKSGALENLLNKANPREATDKIQHLIETEITDESSEGHSGGDIDTNMDMDGSAKKKCSFGIGQITEAAAKIAGNTNCKSRVYDIVYHINPDTDDIIMDKQKRPNQPILLAITRSGE